MPIIQVPEDIDIYVIGDIHEHSEQLFSLLTKIYQERSNDDYWIISVGDVYDKGFGVQAAEIITQELINLQNQGRGFAVRGNHELKQIKIAKKTGSNNKYLAWWAKQPLSYTFQFNSDFKLTVVHAGVSPLMTQEDLEKNQNIAYIRTVTEEGNYVSYIYDKITGHLMPSKPGKIWHEVYDGRFGFICSGHDEISSGIAKIYQHSSNIDTCVPFTGKLTAQKFTKYGPSQLIDVTDVAFCPKLNAR